MSSQRKIDSSRANGAKSHGPKTPEGRQKSSLNSLKHGLTAKTHLVAGENPDDLDAFTAAIVDHFLPQDDCELDLVLEIASLRWRLRRVPSIETGLFDRQPDSPEDAPHVRLAQAYTEIEKSLDFLSRYESRLQRRYNQTLAALLKLRSAKSKPADPPVENKIAPNEPNPKSGRQDVVHPPARPAYRPSSALVRALFDASKSEVPNDAA